jgi:hypothetical protein
MPRDELALDTIARFIEEWSERTDASFAGCHSDDATTNATLARQADVIQPVSSDQGTLLSRPSRSATRKVCCRQRRAPILGDDLGSASRLQRVSERNHAADQDNGSTRR